MLAAVFFCFNASSVPLIYSVHGKAIFKNDQKKITIGKDCRYIKRHYRKTYLAIKEFALRKAPDSYEKRQAEFDKQCMAFRAIEVLWNSSAPGSKSRKSIKIGLLRWNWLEGDPVLDNPRPVDWYMVYMECIYKKKK
ncbi:hypothetical protein [Saccharicrinis sp. GN24d3]|uniref:hypothetical protein n=1 Tax=Saccharicrinis sp. GN24d3 TaxID=3458416 RepID=UPI0040353F6D